MRGVWQGSEKTMHDLLVEDGDLAVFIINEASPANPVGSAFLILKNPSELEAALKSEKRYSASSTIRLVGSENVLTLGQYALDKMHCKQGKHILLTRPTQFQFFARENRLRMQKRIRVLVVDDSETIRKLLSRIISADPDLECVGAVELPSQVDKAIQELKPEVVTLDIHMPEMNGVELLKKLLPKYALPTVMISSLSKEEGTFVLDALEAGAVDYIQKPTMNDLPLVAPMICEKIKYAAQARILTQRKSIVRMRATGELDQSFIIGIGSSTGGTEALKDVLTRLPPEIPPILIVQHIPAVFSKAFADRMNSICPFRVKEAENGETVEKNTVYVAPGGLQMRVDGRAQTLKIVIEDTAPVNRHKPSVDVLFDSMVQLKRKKMVAAILTGMGADGARGMLRLKEAGASTIAQNEATCVVYGMPKEAVKFGGVNTVLPLGEIADEIIKLVSQSKRSIA